MNAEEQAKYRKMARIAIADAVRSGYNVWEMADTILTLTGDDGKPLLVVLDPDQTLPPELASCGFGCGELLKNWRKILVKPC